MNNQITVKDWQGKELEIKEDEFVKKWVDHARGFCHICTTDEQSELNTLVEKIARRAFRTDLALSK